MLTCNNLRSVLQADVQSQYSRNTGTVQALVWDDYDMKHYWYKRNISQISTQKRKQEVILCVNLRCRSVIIIERWLTVWEASCLNDLISSVVASPSGTVLPLWKITAYLHEMPTHIQYMYLQNVFPLMSIIRKKIISPFSFRL